MSGILRMSTEQAKAAIIANRGDLSALEFKYNHRSYPDRVHWTDDARDHEVATPGILSVAAQAALKEDAAELLDHLNRVAPFSVNSTAIEQLKTLAAFPVGFDSGVFSDATQNELVLRGTDTEFNLGKVATTAQIKLLKSHFMAFDPKKITSSSSAPFSAAAGAGVGQSLARQDTKTELLTPRPAAGL